MALVSLEQFAFLSSSFLLISLFCWFLPSQPPLNLLVNSRVHLPPTCFTFPSIILVMYLSVFLPVSEIFESGDCILFICEYGCRSLYTRLYARHHLNYCQPDRLCSYVAYIRQTLSVQIHKNVIMKKVFIKNNPQAET